MEHSVRRNDQQEVVDRSNEIRRFPAGGAQDSEKAGGMTTGQDDAVRRSSKRMTSCCADQSWIAKHGSRLSHRGLKSEDCLLIPSAAQMMLASARFSPDRQIANPFFYLF
ncbi:hypothetical protein [Cobetia crustatorum]|uniref:hypothetical protein n=1 Tax=Cobetia crustatorum TaxID=553385 RepID=UPI00146FB33A|nr:hypothetical protein [Cobetia crustatorum]